MPAPQLSTLINQLCPVELPRAYYRTSFRHKPKENWIHNDGGGGGGDRFISKRQVCRRLATDVDGAAVWPIGGQEWIGFTFCPIQTKTRRTNAALGPYRRGGRGHGVPALRNEA